MYKDDDYLGRKAMLACAKTHAENLQLFLDKLLEKDWQKGDASTSILLTAIFECKGNIKYFPKLCLQSNESQQKQIKHWLSSNYGTPYIADWLFTNNYKVKQMTVVLIGRL